MDRRLCISQKGFSSVNLPFNPVSHDSGFSFSKNVECCVLFEKIVDGQLFTLHIKRGTKNSKPFLALYAGKKGERPIVGPVGLDQVSNHRIFLNRINGLTTTNNSSLDSE